MTDGDALFRTVLLTPDDDTARLVLADYLEENGEADRAALIRWQIETGWAWERDQSYTGRWAGEGGRPVPPAVVRGVNAIRSERWSFGSTVRRGFIDEARPKPQDFLAEAPRLFARHPVREVRMEGKAPIAVVRGSHGWTGGLASGATPERWLWTGYDGDHRGSPLWPCAWDLPVALLEGLPGGEYEPGEPAHKPSRLYRTEAAAWLALVDYGRAAAGLPPLGTRG